jgi:hypothetical protein
MIYILEDKEDRIRRFGRAAEMAAPGVPVRIWRSAPAMIADLVDGLEHASIISLDHDLDRRPGDSTDPGTGYDVAKLFAELIPFCPIIIHTSNNERAQWMEGELSRAGWQFDRVFPFGDDWIEKEWAAVVRRRIMHFDTT